MWSSSTHAARAVRPCLLFCAAFCAPRRVSRPGSVVHCVLSPPLLRAGALPPRPLSIHPSQAHQSHTHIVRFSALTLIVIRTVLVVPNTTKKIRHKPFYAAEVKLVNLKLRAFASTFSEPLKQTVALDEPGPELRKGQARVPNDDNALEWLDRDDFVEIDWVPSDRNPTISFIPVAACPRFTYVRQSSGQAVLSESQSTMTTETSRFGSEDTHVCLMGKEPCELFATREY